MAMNYYRELNNIYLSGQTFALFKDFIRTQSGIQIFDAKKDMLKSRLFQRMRKLNVNSFEEYYDYVVSPRGKKNELQNMVDAVTTNKTDFFRDPAHFHYLSEKALPNVLKIRKLNGKGHLRIWSAGCSIGKEPYSLAISLSEFKRKYPGFRYSILATDISARVLIEAHKGIFKEKDLKDIPYMFRKKYFLKGAGNSKGRIRVIPELRSKITFRKINFMSPDFGLFKKMDVIFFRNVLIYFDKQTQQEVLKRVIRYLAPGGYLFTGASESLYGISTGLESMASSIFRKKAR